MPLFNPKQKEMKTILYIFLCISTMNLIAQPTINSDAIVQLGEEESTTFLPIQTQNWNSGMSGQNINWDYSSLSMGDVCDYIAMDPMNSPYFDSFPDSDIYFVCTFDDSQGFTTEQHTFYQVEGDILQLAGNVSISISNPAFDSIFIVYTDFLDSATFPYSYEGNSEDTFEARITSYLGDQIIVAIQEGTSTHEVDSYGSLTTPSGIFENTLRVKRIELAENSIPGIPFSSPQESYRYTWYAEGENGVILNLDSIVIKDFTGNVQSTELTGSYRTMGPTSTETLSSLKKNITIYPNPTQEEIFVELPNLSDYQLDIYSVQGEKIAFTVTESTDNSKRIKLSDSKLSNGIYFIRISDNQNNTKLSKAILVNN